MLTIVRMLMDVGGNMRGEFAGFAPDAAAALVLASKAEVVCEFNPETHRFDAETGKAVLLVIEPVLTASPDEEVASLQAEMDLLKKEHQEELLEVQGTVVDQAQTLDALKLERDALLAQLAQAKPVVPEPAPTAPVATSAPSEPAPAPAAPPAADQPTQS